MRALVVAAALALAGCVSVSEDLSSVGERMEADGVKSAALLGTSMSAPFSFKPSYSMFMARRCRAVGLCSYDRAASANDWAISSSA